VSVRTEGGGALTSYVGVATDAITGEEIARSDLMDSSREAYCWAYDNSKDWGPRRVTVEKVEVVE